MRCTTCRRPMNTAEWEKRHEEYDEDGRLRGIHHAKCWRVQERQKHMGPTRRYYESSPGVYEVPNREHRDDDEEPEKKWSDWREPVEVEIDDLIRHADEREDRTRE